MLQHVLNLRNLAAFGLICASGITAGPPAQAQDAADIAHRAVRAKILRDAGDRYAVRFRSTHTDRLTRGERRVTGVGMFRRRGKSSQTFTYHADVNVRSDRAMDTGYNIQ